MKKIKMSELAGGQLENLFNIVMAELEANIKKEPMAVHDMTMKIRFRPAENNKWVCEPDVKCSYSVKKGAHGIPRVLRATAAGLEETAQPAELFKGEK